MAVAAIVAAMAVPQVMVSVDRSRAWGSARYLASRMALARMQAVGRGATIALRFQDNEAGVAFDVFVDGNRNGVRTREIATGVDPLLEPPVRLGEMFPGVAIDLSPDASSLMSFTHVGTATSGTIYIRGRDGSRFAVRVLGATGRTRVLRYAARTDDWVETF